MSIHAPTLFDSLFDDDNEPSKDEKVVRAKRKKSESKENSENKMSNDKSNSLLGLFGKEEDAIVSTNQMVPIAEESEADISNLDIPIPSQSTENEIKEELSDEGKLKPIVIEFDAAETQLEIEIQMEEAHLWESNIKFDSNASEENEEISIAEVSDASHLFLEERENSSASEMETEEAPEEQSIFIEGYDNSSFENIESSEPEEEILQKEEAFLISEEEDTLIPIDTLKRDFLDAESITLITEEKQYPADNQIEMEQDQPLSLIETEVFVDTFVDENSENILLSGVDILPVLEDIEMSAEESKDEESSNETSAALEPREFQSLLAQAVHIDSEEEDNKQAFVIEIKSDANTPTKVADELEKLGTDSQSGLEKLDIAMRLELPYQFLPEPLPSFEEKVVSIGINHKKNERKQVDIVTIPPPDKSSEEWVQVEDEKIELEEWHLDKNYYGIGAVAKMFGVNISHIRFWTNEFNLKPRTNKKGDRLYTPENIKMLQLIHHLVKVQHHTIKGAKEKLKNRKEAVDAGKSLKDFLVDLKSTLMDLRSQID